MIIDKKIINNKTKIEFTIDNAVHNVAYIYLDTYDNRDNYLSEIEEKHMLVIKKRLQSEFRNSQRTRILDYTNYSPSIPIAANALQESKNWPTITV